MTVTVVPAFHDQKQKSSGGGGFSDGGVHCERASLSDQSVEFGPPQGVAWSAFNASGAEAGTGISVQAINFDSNVGVKVEEYFVFADGTQQKTGETDLGAMVGTLGPAPSNEGAVQACSPYLAGGGILAYPNKLRYKLALGYQEQALPTARVLLHFDVAEYDMPKDQA